MKLVLPDIDHVFNTENGLYNTIVIESPQFLTKLLLDIYAQIDHQEGRCIVSIDNKPVPLSKYVEVLSDILRFDINKKPLLNRIATAISNRLIESEYYEATMKILADIERVLDDIVYDMDGDLIFPGLSSVGLVKMANPVIADDFERITDRIIEYMDLVTIYESEKLFITLNMRSFIDDEEMQAFADTIIRHGFQVLSIENREYDTLAQECRFIIDEDLCEIQKP